MKRLIPVILLLICVFISCEKDSTTPQSPALPQDPIYPVNPGIAGPGIWVSYASEDWTGADKSILAKYSFTGELMVYLHFLYIDTFNVNCDNGIVWASLMQSPDNQEFIVRINDTGETVNRIPSNPQTGYLHLYPRAVYDSADECWLHHSLPNDQYGQSQCIVERFDSTLMGSYSHEFRLVLWTLCDQRDGSCWVQEAYPPTIVKINYYGSKIIEFQESANGFRIDYLDGAIWYHHDSGPVPFLRKCNEAGKMLFDIQLSGIYHGFLLNPYDGTVIYHAFPNTLVKYDVFGHQLWEIQIGKQLGGLDYCSDSSFWVGDSEERKIYLLSSTGVKLSEFSTTFPPGFIMIHE